MVVFGDVGGRDGVRRPFLGSGVLHSSAGRPDIEGMWYRRVMREEVKREKVKKGDDQAGRRSERETVTKGYGQCEDGQKWRRSRSETAKEGDSH